MRDARAGAPGAAGPQTGPGTGPRTGPGTGPGTGAGAERAARAEAPRDLPEAFSVWLDLLRIAAALVVLVGHAANVRFTDGVIFVVRTWTLAPDAVIVFFVISGLVIARAAGRDGSAGAYAFNRITRLVSVIAPALVLTFVLDRIGRGIDPGAYPAMHYTHLPPAEFFLRGLSLTQEWRGIAAPVQLGSNAPLWSLSFEASYYLMLGVAVFGRGWLRLGLLAGIGWLAGVSILALMPAWLSGVAVWRWGCMAGRGPRGIPAFLLAVLPLGLLVALKIADADRWLTQFTGTWILGGSAWMRLGYAHEALWGMVIATCLALHLVGMRGLPPLLPGGVARAVRWLAGASFSIYVVHYPVMHLLDAAVPEDVPGKVAIFLVVPLCAGLLFAEVFERRLPGLRARLRRGRGARA